MLLTRVTSVFPIYSTLRVAEWDCCIERFETDGEHTDRKLTSGHKTRHQFPQSQVLS